MTLDFSSPPVSAETQAHLVHLFCMSDPYRLAYIAARQQLHPEDDPLWQDIYAEVSRRDASLAGQLRPTAALHIRQTLPPIHGRALDGTPAALKPIGPHRKQLPIGHLPYLLLDPEMVPLLQRAGLWDVPWYVTDRGNEGTGSSGGLTVKLTTATAAATALPHRHSNNPKSNPRSNLSARKVIAELALGRPLDAKQDGRVYAAANGHPGDLRLSRLVLAKPGHRAPRIATATPTLADDLLLRLQRLSLPHQT